MSNPLDRKEEFSVKPPQDELCHVPERDIQKRRTILLTRLYELRLHVAKVADGLSRTHNLTTSLHAFNAHEAIVAAITDLETKHPELT
jgi:hypothetical protein